MNQKVLEYLQNIPEGKVTTYKNIATLFSLHPRKIAMIMKHNKYPETYPCYKVIAHNGKISGYNTSAGVKEKIQKLEADGIVIFDGKIENKYII